jgi:hypothetical protein
MKKFESIALASIVVDKRYQTRAAMDDAVINEYADAIKQAGGWPFPPIKVVGQVLADGFHRVKAARRVIAARETPADLRKALKAIPCEIVAVDRSNADISDLALRHALSANHTHGLRRSQADKRRSVRLAIGQWSNESNRNIAKLTGTTHPFVAKVREELRVETLPPTKSLQVVIEKLKLGEGLHKFHHDAQGEMVGVTVIGYLNAKDPFKRYQIFDWNGPNVAFSQWGSISRLLWTLNQLRPDLVASDFEHNSDVRTLMERAYPTWVIASPDDSSEYFNKPSSLPLRK